ncbi:alpha-1,2-fucosyltransferase [Synechococcus sp. CBW1108]|uniref:alpha-1,2-fucosyltransferase n=1 Tax=Synechococcus sp. CBW1108 TaxID=1353147 RepID=UPI0018CCF53F|nr:alpha-1,2-fucosyltransferase [Synechococcus sp. CBW1108]QPN69510.1 alpha-1,2-fucosyltransferase [Synechococcus sp. CBW1108]
MKLVVWKDYGQLGNRLLTFSSLIALSLHKNWSIYNPSFKIYSSYFEYFEPQFVPCYKAKKSTNIVDVIFDTKIFWSIINTLLTKKPVLNCLRRTNLLFEVNDLKTLDMHDIEKLLIDYNNFFLVWAAWALNCEELRSKYRDALVTIFRPQKFIRETVDKNFSRLASQKLTIGVHIRRGDYISWENGKYFFSYELYNELMLRFEDLYGSNNVQFLICSNERVPNNLLEFKSRVFLNGSTMDDLYTLAKCDVIVGPPSTFSEWAAFYGAKKRFVFNGLLPVKKL